MKDKAVAAWALVKRRAIWLKERMKDDSLSLVAGGVAFFVFLSIFPALASVISIYGLIADAQTVENQVAAMGAFVPAEVLDLISARLKSIADTAGGSLTLGLVLGLSVSLWSANKAMKALVKALNIIYNTSEARGFIRVNLVAMGLTVLSSVVFILGVSLVMFVPVLVSAFLTSAMVGVVTLALSWVLFLALLTGLSAMLYSLAPSHPIQRWRDTWPGAATTAVLFVLTSVAFSTYVNNFGRYDEQYGALGAVVVTLLWLFIGAFVFLFGAEINAMVVRERERKRSVESIDTVRATSQSRS